MRVAHQLPPPPAFRLQRRRQALAELVKEMTASTSEIEHISYDRAYGPGFEDMQRRSPDIGKLKTLIGYEPQNDLRAIVQSVIDYYL